MPNRNQSYKEPFDEKHIARLFQHRYWTTEIAEQVLEAWQKSGVTKRAFSRRFGVKPGRLEHWGRRLRKEREKGGEIPLRVYPVKVTGRAGSSRKNGSGNHGADIDMVLPSGVVLKLGADFDGAMLRRVLEAVGC